MRRDRPRIAPDTAFPGVASRAAFRAGAALNPINVVLTPKKVALVLTIAAPRRSHLGQEGQGHPRPDARRGPPCAGVIRFDPVGDDASPFAGLLNSPGTAPDMPGPIRRISPRLATPPIRPAPEGSHVSHRAVLVDAAGSQVNKSSLGHVVSSGSGWLRRARRSLTNYTTGRRLPYGRQPSNARSRACPATDDVI